MPVNNVSLLSVNSFSGLEASEVINISAVPVNTGLVIVYITDSVISNLVFTGGSVASIAAPIATFVVAVESPAFGCFKMVRGLRLSLQPSRLSART
jgi:phage tail sheath gpL-like